MVYPISSLLSCSFLCGPGWDYHACFQQRLACVCVLDLWKSHRIGGGFGKSAFRGMVFMMRPCLGRGCKFHWVEFCSCTARLTHRCFPDSSPAFLCHSRLLLLTLSKVHFVVFVACLSSPAPLVSDSPTLPSGMSQKKLPYKLGDGDHVSSYIPSPDLASHVLIWHGIQMPVSVFITIVSLPKNQ